MSESRYVVICRRKDDGSFEASAPTYPHLPAASGTTVTAAVDAIAKLIRAEPEKPSDWGSFLCWVCRDPKGTFPVSRDAQKKAGIA